MKEIFTGYMTAGPKLYSSRHKIYFYGAYHVLTFTGQEAGKELKVTVNTSKPVCWVELWPSAYDGHDWVRWTTERGQDALVRSGDKPQLNPTLSCKIQPGVYTLYFVNSSPTQQVKDELITYQIEIN